MTRLFKTTAIAALALTTAMPAFATGQTDLNSMDCGMYNDLAAADKDKVAMMAIDEVSSGSASQADASNDTAKATADTTVAGSTESPVGEAPDSAMAITTTQAGSDMSAYAEDVAILNDICMGNREAALLDAAAGVRGNR